MRRGPFNQKLPKFPRTTALEWETVYEPASL